MEVWHKTIGRWHIYNDYIHWGENSNDFGLPAEKRECLKPAPAVNRLATTIRETKRNIVADIWFS